MRFPPYAYVPGHWPHPSRDPEGHSFGRDTTGAVVALVADAWQDNAHWTDSIALFDHGYYWEAHEALEALWIAAGRTGALGELINGVIKLAAAGVKLRQGLQPQAVRLAGLASERLAAAQVRSDTDTLAGLSFARLRQLVREAQAAGPLNTAPTQPVATVFAQSLQADATPDDAQRSLDVTFDYHRRSKHLPGRFAASRGYLDWDTQPDPFRLYEGAPQLPLALEPVGAQPRYEHALVRGHVEPRAIDAASLGQLFQDALGLSAWKEVPASRWALRVNPSSGNLHPTEGYLIAGPITDLTEHPGVYHYNSHAHALELRRQLPASTWQSLTKRLPPDTLFIGLSSIHWREAWKYGERAFRYCQHDVGHAIACVAIAAAGLGWDTRMLDSVTDDALAVMLGIDAQVGPEAEHPDCLLAVFAPSGSITGRQRLDIETAFPSTEGTAWQGTPNRLSRSHHDWPAIDEVASATRKHRPSSPSCTSWRPERNACLEVGDSTLSLRKVIHTRRSAVAFDGRSGITRAAFHQILLRTLPGADQIPFTAIPQRPRVDLLLFVHRVKDVPPGLYALVRDPKRLPHLREAMAPTFKWERSEGSPSALGLYLLERGDARRVAQQTSCGQEIAADGVFAVAMLAEYRESILAHGPFAYRQLFWETGVIGQVLYLEAEASGVRGTGIGCFFDELTERTFGITGERFQVLYHFAMGGPVEDARLRTAPPYGHLRSSRSRPV